MKYAKYIDISTEKINKLRCSQIKIRKLPLVHYGMLMEAFCIFEYKILLLFPQNDAQKNTLILSTSTSVKPMFN